MTEKNFVTQQEAPDRIVVKSPGDWTEYVLPPGDITYVGPGMVEVFDTEKLGEPEPQPAKSADLEMLDRDNMGLWLHGLCSVPFPCEEEKQAEERAWLKISDVALMNINTIFRK